MRGMQ